MIFDDGSTLDPYSGASTPAPAGMLLGDVYDNAQMGSYSAGGTPWWQSLVQYGAVRAIDNRYGPVNVAGNTNAGTFAGANGRTYGNAGTNNNGQTLAGQVGVSSNLLMLVLIAAAVYAIAK
jgi:hypothetical protein